MSDKEERVVLGNEAIARGVVESGCQFFAAYPGTPSSEILPAIVRFKKENNLDIYVEWSTNEKVAFENALAGAPLLDIPACLRIGVSFMPQIGQLPGLFWMTCGCMPHV